MRNEDIESALFSAELGDAPTLDLHGQSVNVAIDMLSDFINHEFMEGSPVIKIIHGRGSGVLRKAVHAWLNSQKTLVAQFRDAQTPDASGGVTVVALHRR